MPPDGEREPQKFYINFDVDNFKVSEKGSLVDCITDAEGVFEDENNNPNDSDAGLSEGQGTLL